MLHTKLQEKEDYSAPGFADHTELDVQFRHGGFALTWAF